MILSLLVCGKLKAGPETELVRDYLLRAKRQGRSLGVTDVICKELSLAKGTSKAAGNLAAFGAVGNGAKRVVLDETGTQMSTEQFANTLNQWREQGVPEICLMVGPADGWDKPIGKDADIILGLGKMTWPHKLVHVLAAEQIYRALSLTTGSPYHRGTSS